MPGHKFLGFPCASEKIKRVQTNSKLNLKSLIGSYQVFVSRINNITLYITLGSECSEQCYVNWNAGLVMMQVNLHSSNSTASTV